MSLTRNQIRLLIGAVTHADAPDVVRTTTVFVLLVLAFFALLDLSYGWLDPRLRRGRTQH